MFPFHLIWGTKIQIHENSMRKGREGSVIYTPCNKALE